MRHTLPGCRWLGVPNSYLTSIYAPPRQAVKGDCGKYWLVSAPGHLPPRQLSCNVSRGREYNPLDGLTIAKERASVKNTATAFGLLLDLAERHLDEIAKAIPHV